MLRRLALGALLTLSGGLLLACGALGSTEAVTFNNKIVNANKRLEQADKTFADRLKVALDGNPANVPPLKQAHEDMKQTLASVKAEVDGMKVPSKQSARDFHAAELRYLASAERIVADYGEIVRILDDRTLNVFAKQTQVQAIAARVTATAKSDTAGLENAQAAFAKDYNIRIIK